MKSSHADLVAQLADQFGRMVFATAYRILGNRDEAEDAYQEVFLKLMKTKKPDILPERTDEWGAYLRVVASRCAIDLLHRRPKWDSANEEQLETLESPNGNDPRSAAAQRQQAEILRQALSGLPERDARIFTLRHFESLSYERIAHLEQLSVSAVGVILHRASQRLRKILEPMVSRDVQNKAAEGIKQSALSKEEDHG